MPSVPRCGPRTGDGRRRAPTTLRRAATARRCNTPGRSPQFAASPALPVWLTVGGLVGLIGLSHWAHGTPSDFRHGLMLVVSLCAAALIAGLVLDSRTTVSRLLASPPLVFLGAISYGV